MAWVTLNEDDVQRRLTAAELTALKTAAKASGQDGDTILSEAIQDVVKRVRGYVAACRDNLLGEGMTIPDELRGAALARVRDFLFTRLPGMKSLNDDIRQEEAKSAVATLRDVAACKMAVVQPTTASSEVIVHTSVQQLTGNTRQATREKMGGL
jgi:hypothetical protein